MEKSQNKMYFLLITIGIVASQNIGPIVQTNNGRIQGVTINQDSTTITKFLGIPFAKSPTGALRFMKPEKMDQWSGVLPTTKFGPSCHETKDYLLPEYFGPLPKFNHSEDCLFINIFIPGEIDTSNLKAVMVFIYGGGWFLGNSNSYPADRIVATEDVIVVTFNYRLGLFGFFGSGNGVFPGNMGLFDQHAALQWVNANIAAFGGDNSKITIFGESAGADSVLNHLISPLSKNLFQRAIIQSPPSMGLLIKQERQYSIVKELAESKCGKPAQAKDLLECLQQLSATDVLDISDASLWKGFTTVTVDGDFLVDEPTILLRNGQFDTSKEVIVGFMSDDGVEVIKTILDWNQFIQDGITTKQAKEVVIPFDNTFYFKPWQDVPNKAIMQNLLYQKYISCKNNPLDIARGTLDMSTDSAFTSKTFEIASYVALHGGKVFVYEFEHKLSAFKDVYQTNMEINAEHTDDLYFLFGYMFGLDLKKVGISVTPEEENLSHSIRNAFAEFARTGQPKYLTTSNKAVNWNPYTLLNEEYLKFTINMNHNSTQPVPKALLERVKLWNKVLPGINSIHTCDTSFGGDEWTGPRVNKGSSNHATGMIDIVCAVVVILIWLQ